MSNNMEHTRWFCECLLLHNSIIPEVIMYCNGQRKWAWACLQPSNSLVFVYVLLEYFEMFWWWLWMWIPSDILNSHPMRHKMNCLDDRKQFNWLKLVYWRFITHKNSFFIMWQFLSKMVHVKKKLTYSQSCVYWSKLIQNLIRICVHNLPTLKARKPYIYHRSILQQFLPTQTTTASNILNRCLTICQITSCKTKESKYLTCTFIQINLGSVRFVLFLSLTTWLQHAISCALSRKKTETVVVSYLLQYTSLLCHHAWQESVCVSHYCRCDFFSSDSCCICCFLSPVTSIPD